MVVWFDAYLDGLKVLRTQSEEEALSVPHDVVKRVTWEPMKKPTRAFRKVEVIHAG